MLTLPTHETTLPASGKPIEITPLLVRDEKSIAAAKRAGSKADSYRTFLNILQEKINTDITKLAEVDLIHCMLKLRKISIGSMVNVNFVCPYTQQRVDVNLNLADVELKGKHKEKTLKSDNFIVKLGLPLKVKNIESGIISIQTEEETIVMSEILPKEKNELIDSLPIKLRNEITEKLQDIINYTHDVEYETNQKHSIPLRSAEDFFTLFFVM
tara:strand:- start:182 stop:820 length:639 start_codon:yes stop_codon:yes gene_type:complete